MARLSPYAKDPNSHAAGTGGPSDGTFKNLATGETEKRFNGGNILDENISRDTNAPGTLSMANTGSKNTGGSQFFINVADNWRLDWFSEGPSQHPVFARVVSGYDTCVAISQVPTNDDNPLSPIRVDATVVRNLPS